MVLCFCMDIVEQKKLLLLEAFEAGCDKRQACIFAGISIKDLAKYELEHPEFVQQQMDLNASKEAHARVAVLRKIKRAAQSDKEDVKSDADLVKWALERTTEEFKPKSNQDITSDGKALPITIQIVKPE